MAPLSASLEMRVAELRSLLQKKHRPHIFGMTASPLDTKLTADQAKISAFFQELEANLDSKASTFGEMCPRHFVSHPSTAFTHVQCCA